MANPVSKAESDRRLRPVLDDLSEHNSKQALKHVNQALQKRPGWPAARALRACVYLQMKKLKQAKEEISKLREDLSSGRVPIDEDVAAKIQYYYQEIGNEGGTGEVYEQAWKSEVSNVDLAEMAFCYYVRGNAFTSAQKLATKLHRMTSSNTEKYGLWAAAAIWLDVVYRSRDVEGPTSSPDERILKLACRIMDKALNIPVTPSAEATRFATRLYRDNMEHEKAKKLISQRRLVMDEAEVLHIRADLQPSDDLRMKDYCSLLSNHDRDDWGHWLKYLDCVEKVGLGTDDAQNFIDVFVQRELKEDRPKRSPFLAQLELLYRTEEIQALSIAVSDYFSRFGAKTVCAHDLRPYLMLLSKTPEFEKVMDRILVMGNKQGFPFQLTASWLGLWFDRLSQSPAELMQYYQDHLSDNLESTDRQSGDDYILLVAHKLLPTTGSCPHDRYSNVFAVLQSIVVIEVGLTRSPHNFHFKLLLIHLYSEIGAMERVTELWLSLEVKHIQMSTLAHIVLKPFFETGHHDSLRKIFEAMEILWRECDLELPQCVTKAFQVGSVNAAVEFILFRQRLERSAVLIESMLLEAQVALIRAEGEASGIENARHCLTFVPRFTPASLQSKRIVDNDDNRCFKFWDLHNYDPAVRLNDLTVEEEEQGRSCTQVRKATIISDLQGLLHLMQVIGQEDDFESDNMEAPSKPSSNGHASRDPEIISALRERIASNLRRSKMLLISYTSGSSSHEDENPSNGLDSERILSESMELIKAMRNEVQDALKDTENSVALKGTMSPGQLRRCCKISFEILLIVSIAISSFSVELMKGKRRRKRGSTKASKFKSTVCFDNVQKAILEYKRGVLSSCSLIQEWITGSLDQDADWLGVVCESEETLSESLTFLPEMIHPINLPDGSKQARGSIGRSAFCHDVLEQIRSSHMASCTRLLETLSGVTRRLKLVDL
ncbi:N-acetyltransferase B complex (NatB) non catalytic subunit [Gracilaria domingensis]|nr:N-acetyltransferase B complex (NatB) non catalytic subunit [Gracilaria domingensis]